MDEDVIKSFAARLANDDVHAWDLLLSAFACSASSPKRASCCKPFPPQMAFVNPEGEKAFKRAAEAACNLPNLQSLQLNAAVVTEKKLTQEQLEDLNLLLQWLMLENSQRNPINQSNYCDNCMS